MDASLDEALTRVALLGDRTRRLLYQHISATDQPVSRDEAAEVAGVPRSVAAFHLDKLADHGLLSTEFRRLSERSGPGAGRPSKLYRRSDREFTISVPTRDYGLAGLLLAEAIDRAEQTNDAPSAELQRVAEAYGRRLGQEAKDRTTADGDAERSLLDVLTCHGFEPRQQPGEIVLGNCPFRDLAVQFSTLVCGMNLHIMRGLHAELAGTALKPRLDPGEDRCCIRFGEHNDSC